MNKILIVYVNNAPFFYIWDGGVGETLEESVDWILTYVKSITDFDLIETVLDLETYKQLYNESLYNIC
jgi:hypothetical protein